MRQGLPVIYVEKPEGEPRPDRVLDERPAVKRPLSELSKGGLFGCGERI